MDSPSFCDGTSAVQQDDGNVHLLVFGLTRRATTGGVIGALRNWTRFNTSRQPQQENPDPARFSFSTEREKVNGERERLKAIRCWDGKIGANPGRSRSVSI